MEDVNSLLKAQQDARLQSQASQVSSLFQIPQSKVDMSNRIYVGF